MDYPPQLRQHGLARSSGDRNYRQRSAPEGPDALWDRPGTLAIVSYRGRTLVRRRRLITFDQDELPTDQLGIYLGHVPADQLGEPSGSSSPEDGKRHVIGIVLDDDGRSAIDSRLADALAVDATARLDDDGVGPDSLTPVWLGLRDVGTVLSDSQIGLITALVALENWHRTHQFSPRTGTPTVPVQSGWVRQDPSDGSEHFPRTDPAIIAAVLHQDPDGTERILLANNALWESDRYSTLAGFVEPGETLEAAVVREIGEESGITVKDAYYAGSQAWPFPASLMLGFYATALSRDVAVDGVEIRTARWFTRNELTEAMERGSIQLPPPVSIARNLIDNWLERSDAEPQ